MNIINFYYIFFLRFRKCIYVNGLFPEISESAYRIGQVCQFGTINFINEMNSPIKQMKRMFTHIHLLQFRHYSLSEKDDQLRLCDIVSYCNI